jgi:transcriptional regulator with XRE-family HTH domain
MDQMERSARLKELRVRLGIRTRDVERQSRRIADRKENEEYYLSHGWLSQLENSNITPSIHKLYSLSVIYHSKFKDLLLLYGVDLEDLATDQLAVGTPATHLIGFENHLENGDENAVVVPINERDPGFERTSLISRDLEKAKKSAISLLRYLNPANGLCGYIGLRDYTLYPLIRPGAVVLIDDRIKKVERTHWRTEFDRPIYFLELRDGYACGWCEINDRQLSILPHPNSPMKIRQFSLPNEAEIIGRVTDVLMRVVEVSSASAA